MEVTALGFQRPFSSCLPPDSFRCSAYQRLDSFIVSISDSHSCSYFAGLFVLGLSLYTPFYHHPSMVFLGVCPQIPSGLYRVWWLNCFSPCFPVHPLHFPTQIHPPWSPRLPSFCAGINNLAFDTLIVLVGDVIMTSKNCF